MHPHVAFRKAGQIVVSLNTGPRRILARNRLPDAGAVARHGLLVIGTNRCVGCKLSSLARSCTSPRACNSIGHLRIICETFGSDVDIPHGLSILRPLDSGSSSNRSRLTALNPPFWRQPCIHGKKKASETFGVNPGTYRLDWWH